jgi:hypothetical protein
VYTAGTVPARVAIISFPRSAYYIRLVRRNLEMVAERVGEIHGPDTPVIHDPSGALPLPNVELRQTGHEGQPVRAAESKGDPVKPAVDRLP